MNNTTYKKTMAYCVVLLIVLTMAFTFMGSAPIADAAATQYSDVMEDLATDADFDVEDYPAYEGDYNLKIIQIAESTSKELFVYVYQPSYVEVGQMDATSIVFSTTPDSPSFKAYKLRLLSRKDVFAKYLVEGYTVENKAEREYAISEIFRPKKSFDSDTDDDNQLNEIACEVAQNWQVVDSDDSVIYTMDTLDVVTIVHQWAGEIYMNNGCDFSGAIGVKFENVMDIRHFISFRCNYEINHLYEAEVSFVTQDVFFNSSLFVDGVYNVKRGTWSDPQTVVLHDDHYNENSVHGIGGRAHKWSDIETVDEFEKNVDLEAGVAEKMQGDQYVLSFYTTDVYWKYNWGDVDYDYKFTDVAEVTILRLKFETKGETYNLGVVGNKQTSDGINDNDLDKERPTWSIGSGDGSVLKSLLIALGVIFGLAIIVLIIIGIIKLFSAGIGRGNTSKTDFNINLGDYDKKSDKSDKKRE